MQTPRGAPITTSNCQLKTGSVKQQVGKSL